MQWVLEHGFAAKTLSEFRRGALAELQASFGFDLACFHDLDPRSGIDPALVVGIEPQALQGIVHNWARYASVMKRPMRQMIAGEPASLSRSLSTAAKARHALYREIHQRNGIRHDLQGILTVRPGTFVSVVMGRRSGRDFNARDTERFGALLPMLTMVDAAVRYRTAITVDAALSDRERELVSLVALGLTNAQIGMALDISPLTVRNRLVRLYRVFSVSTRAELVGLVANKR